MKGRPQNRANIVYELYKKIILYWHIVYKNIGLLSATPRDHFMVMFRFRVNYIGISYTTTTRVKSGIMNLLFSSTRCVRPSPERSKTVNYIIHINYRVSASIHSVYIYVCIFLWISTLRIIRFFIYPYQDMDSVGAKLFRFWFEL